MKRALLALVLLAVPAFAQGKQVPGVRTPNEGASRVYLGSPEDVLEAGVEAAEQLSLAVTRAPDGSIFIASPTPWLKPGPVSYPRTLVVHVRALSARETELLVEEEGKDKSPGAEARISGYHERVATALGDIRPKKAIIPKHPLEAQGEPVLIKQVDLVGMRPSEDSEDLRAWPLSREYSKEIATSLWRLSGSVPLHFTPTSQRRLMVLDGQVRMSVGTRNFWVASGDFVVIPKAVRAQMDVEPGSKATLLVIESPAVDDAKTVWLEDKDKKKPAN
ncbi:MAG: hypothetical protein K1X89_30835 [Myxococcaceae bacterium]|nr:hypothetical protein [Myxococcaceae bacterium]